MRIDDSDADRFERAAIGKLRSTQKRMKRILDRAAQKERSTHQYKNRTFALQRGTQATQSDSDTITLEMDTEYASYVNAKGLSNIQDVAEEAEQLIYRDLTQPADTED